MADWAEEAVRAFVEEYAMGVDRNTFGFHAWEFKGWLAAALRDAYARGVRGAAEVVREQARVAGLQAGEGAHEEALLLGAADAILALLKGE